LRSFNLLTDIIFIHQFNLLTHPNHSMIVLTFISIYFNNCLINKDITYLGGRNFPIYYSSYVGVQTSVWKIQNKFCKILISHSFHSSTIKMTP